MRTEVVVADDDAGVRELVESALTCEGYHVLPAANGREALIYVVTQAPALVLSDVQMPVMDGWQLLTHLRRSGLSVAVVVMSAGADVRAAAVQHDADGYLVKPFGLDELLETVERFVPDPSP